MKCFEIYEKSNRLNQLTITGKNFHEACVNAGIQKPYLWKCVSWYWAD